MPCWSPSRTGRITTFANLAKVALTAAQRSPKRSVWVGLSAASPIRKKFQWKFFPSSWWNGCPACKWRRTREPARTGGVRTGTTDKRGITRTQIPDVGDLGRIPTRTQIPDVGNWARIPEVRHAEESAPCGQRPSNGIVPRDPAASRVGTKHRVRRWPSSATLRFGSIWFLPRHAI